MSGSDAIGLTALIRDRGADWCICGGWGVDALLGRQTREHKDLDVFVERAALPVTLEQLAAAGYRYAYPWEENVPLDDSAQCAGMDSAFVMENCAGGIVDAHVYALDEGRVVPLWAFKRSWPWPDFACSGSINGTPVTCLTVELQLELHQGYNLPLTHRHDLALLEGLGRRDL